MDITFALFTVGVGAGLVGKIAGPVTVICKLPLVFKLPKDALTVAEPVPKAVTFPKASTLAIVEAEEEKVK